MGLQVNAFWFINFLNFYSTRQTHCRIKRIMNPNQFQTPAIFSELYGNDPDILARQTARYKRLIETHIALFGKTDPELFSAPGRVEIGGNHTDHNHGRVLAAAIHLDSIAAVSKNNSDQLIVHSEGYEKPFIVSTTDLGIKQNEFHTSSALIRGILYRFREAGHALYGLDINISSDVLAGSGLSSSASFEVLLGTIFNVCFADNRWTPQEIAGTGQFAENVYYGKPCGLMDQMTSACGGIVEIDFKDPAAPLVNKLDFNFDTTSYKVLVINTGDDHEDLTDDYAAISREMIAVANALGQPFCRGIREDELIGNLTRLRGKAGDRAILRAFHFLEENNRVLKQVESLTNRRFTDFLMYVNASGNSSAKWLQNMFTVKQVENQGMSLALALTEKYIRDSKVPGACRLHGGGFAGTILAFLHEDLVETYIQNMIPIFGKENIITLKVRSQGSIKIP